MRIRLLLFGALADVARPEYAGFELDDDALAGDVLTVLAEREPRLRDRLGAVAIAVNRAYVRRDRRLAAGDEVALLPPVSGG